MIKRPLSLIGSRNLKTFHEQFVTLSLPDPYDEFSGRKTIIGFAPANRIKYAVLP